MSIAQIGRAFDGLDVDIQQAQWQGGTVTLSGDLNLSAVTAANRPGTAAAVRDRLNALIGSRDEKAVPVVWSEDSSVDGFYKPLDATVSFSNVSLNDGYLTWSVTLQRVGDGSLPQTEVKSMYGVITNPWSITNTTLTNNYALESVCPSTAYNHWNGYSPANGVGRMTESGNLFTFINQGTPAAPAEILHRYTVNPSDGYFGACSLRGTYAGVANTLCLGRQMTPTASTFVLSSGVVRVSIDSGSGRFLIEFYDGDDAAWVTVGPNTWGLTVSGSPTTITTAARLSVLRNSPEQASVRLIGPSTAAYGPVRVDLTVVRGAPYVMGVVRTEGLAYSTIKPATGTACTSLDGGMRQTSNDAKGNRFVVTAGNNGGGTRNLSTGELGQSTAVNRTFVFGVGVEVGGSSSGSTNGTAQNVEYQMLSGRSETQRIVTQ